MWTIENHHKTRDDVDGQSADCHEVGCEPEWHLRHQPVPIRLEQRFYEGPSFSAIFVVHESLQLRVAQNTPHFSKKIDNGMSERPGCWRNRFGIVELVGRIRRQSSSFHHKVFLCRTVAGSDCADVGVVNDGLAVPDSLRAPARSHAMTDRYLARPCSGIIVRSWILGNFCPAG